MSRPIPIMLIHGFNGSAADWEQSAFREHLLAAGADPDLVRVFHYGWRRGGDDTPPLYDNQADIRQVASRLVRRESDEPHDLRSQLTRLSEDSVARGGPAKVTIIAHSMGGLVARYYLSRRTADEWGTVNEGVVGRLITIGTPHLGVDLARLFNLAPADAFIWRVLRWLERWPLIKGQPATELAALDAEIQALQRNAQAEEIPVTAQGYFDSPAVWQMVPGSPFLKELNRPDSLPADVESIVIWGDVQFTAGVQWGFLKLWERFLSLGDLLVTAASASHPYAPHTHRYPFIWERRYQILLREPTFRPADLSTFLPPVSHSNLLRNEAVHQLVEKAVFGTLER